MNGRCIKCGAWDIDDTHQCAKSGAHDWPEDYHHENGNYYNKCHRCGAHFSGHKRRGLCRVCLE